MLIPKARGALSEGLFAAMVAMEPDDDLPTLPAAEDKGDAQIALWTLYELHYRGFEDVDAALEWHPDLLRLRRSLEIPLEARLRARYAAENIATCADPTVAASVFALIEGHRGASLSSYVQRHADRDQVMDLLRMRSIYHLKETDPTAWAVPRLPRASQAALVELMYDEYGCGRADHVHSGLFARALTSTGLDDRYGAYIDQVPTEVLEQNNAMTLFGLHARLRGAAVGHLAAFEATSSLPSRRLVQGLDRLRLPTEVVAYYLEHVEADAVHEQLATRGICAALVEDDPTAAADVFFGAYTCLDLESRFASMVLARWGVAS